MQVGPFVEILENPAAFILDFIKQLWYFLYLQNVTEISQSNLINLFTILSNFFNPEMLAEKLTSKNTVLPITNCTNKTKHLQALQMFCRLICKSMVLQTHCYIMTCLGLKTQSLEVELGLQCKN